MCIYVCVDTQACAWAACGGQKRVLGPPGLKLHTVVCYPEWALGTIPRSSERAGNTLDLEPFLLPLFYLYKNYFKCVRVLHILSKHTSELHP